MASRNKREGKYAGRYYKAEGPIDAIVSVRKHCRTGIQTSFSTGTTQVVSIPLLQPLSLRVKKPRDYYELIYGDE